MTRREGPRWNDWTTLRPVQFDYEQQPTLRAVRLSGATARVGDAVRVGVSGVEVEGRITAIEVSILRVELSPHVPADVRPVIERSAPRPEKRSAKKNMAKASPRAGRHKRQAG